MSSLGGGSDQPLPVGWGRPSAPRVGRIGDWSGNNSGRNTPSSGSSRGGFGSLGTLGSGTGGGRVPGPRVDDDDDKDENKEGETWFAGGERSGISVQNPNAALPGGGLVRDILRQATEGGRAAPPESRRAPGPFSGSGHTLGSDEVESTFVPDPNAVDGDDEDEIAVRQLHLWSDGFSIEDGPLMRYDEPGNQELLRSIQQGTAPLDLMNIRYGQRVTVDVITKLGEAYVPPKRGHFSGSGNRLGAPTPSGSSSAAPSASSMPGSFPIGGSSGAGSITGVERQSINTHFEVDQAQPTTSIQIRLADGTRMPCRMNLTHTVSDIRAFINASRPENLTRPYTIGTTFPNRTLEDDTQTIQAAGLVNSVIVQRWV